MKTSYRYRVCGKSHATGVTVNGNWIFTNLDDAQEWADVADKLAPEVSHWVEEKQIDEEETEHENV